LSAAWLQTSERNAAGAAGRREGAPGCRRHAASGRSRRGSLALIALLLTASAATAQDGSPARDDAGPVPPDSAAKIRASLNQPPAEPPFDVYDALGLPFRAIVYPVALVGRGAAELIGFAAKLARPRETTIFDKLAALGIHPGFGSIGPRSGGAARLRYTGLEPFYVESAFSIRESQLHALGARIASPGYLFDASYRFVRHAQPHFWGVGPDSPEGGERDYRWDRQIAAAVATMRLSRFEIGGGAAYEDNRVARGFDEEELDLQDTPLAAELFGLRERTEYIVLDLDASFDGTSLAQGLQRRGLYLEAGTAVYLGVDGTPSDFHRFRGAVNGYLPLNPLQSLALRGIAEVNQVDSGVDIPFTHLASLGGDNAARAYRTDRFRDRVLLALMSEWRYEVWRELHERGRAEMFLLFDIGTVASTLSAARLDDARPSYGFGTRLNWRGDVVWLAYLAFGDEGARFDVDFSWMF